MKITLFIFALLSCSFAAKWHEFESYEYFFSESYENGYDDVVKTCAAEEATLVLIKTKEIQDFVMDLTTNLANTVAIGLKRVSDGKLGFQWIDGTSVTEGFTYWADGEPDNDVEDCVLLMGSHNGRWKDYSCGGPMQFICQRRIDATTQSTIITTANPTTKAIPNETTLLTTSYVDKSTKLTSETTTTTATTTNFVFTTTNLNHRNSTSTPPLTTSTNIETTTKLTSICTTITNTNSDVTNGLNASFSNIYSSASPTTKIDNITSSTQVLTTKIFTSAQTTFSNSSQKINTEKTTGNSSTTVENVQQPFVRFQRWQNLTCFNQAAELQNAESKTTPTFKVTAAAEMSTGSFTNRSVWEVWQIAVVSATGGFLFLMIIIVLILLFMQKRKNSKLKKEAEAVNLDSIMDSESVSIESKSLFPWPASYMFGDYGKNQGMFPRPSIVAQMF